MSFELTYLTPQARPEGFDPNDVLLKAASLIESGWTKDAGARDRWGHEVDYLSDSAVRFCASGAIYRTIHDLYGSEAPIHYSLLAMEVAEKLAPFTGPDIHITQWNDRQPRGRSGRDTVARAFRIVATREDGNDQLARG